VANDDVIRALTKLEKAAKQLRKALLTDTLPAPPPPTAVQRVLQLVADHYGLTVTDLVGPSRQRQVMRPRHVAMYLLHEHLGLSYVSIGKLLRRDHSTVIFGVRRIQAVEDTEKLLALVREPPVP
jgi:chromosomal replication initiator protein